MDNKNTAMIVTVATALLCGCCSFFMCIFGMFTATGNMPYNTELNGVSNSGVMPPGVGVVMLCFSLIFILIPIVVGFFMLRKKPEVVVSVSSDEPLPPVS